ncbi:MAG: hypothetical protein RBS19_02535 [Bacteroidales bacterium]|nr:hypothetical protein [Bacteroidales bacterium]MDY0215812.1 hypothetical protein [Bacteroidales bacterium]
MKKPNPISQLQEKILLLEAKQQNDKVLLKEQFKLSFESLKPLNLVKDAFNELTNLSGFGGETLGTSLGIAAGYFSKKIVVGSSKNPFKKILGSIVQAGVTSYVMNNTDQIKSFATGLKNSFLGNLNKS